MKLTNMRMSIKPVLVAMLQVAICATANAASVGLSDVPLYVREGVQPNIILSMDDSGSMYWSYLPDDISGAYDTNRAKSSTFNKIYYDPNVTYTPPVDADGKSLGDASFTAAWNDGFDQADTCTVNLSTSYRPTWYYGNHCDTTDEFAEFSGVAAPAYYYRFDNLTGDDDVNNDANYTRVLISASEQQNFANWYSYYRKRIYIAKSAAGLSFANVGPVFRIMRQTINNQSLTMPEEYTGTAKTSFYKWLYDIQPTGLTPLRSALEHAGDVLSDSDNPYRDDPTDSASDARSCRQNFHILMTDGYWNSDGGVGINADARNYTFPTNDFGVTGFTAPMAPYSDKNVDYLADTAFYYWARDLRPLDNNVPPIISNPIYDTVVEGTPDNPVLDAVKTFWHPYNDPADWQHMVTYTIGFGLDGLLDYKIDENLNYGGDFPALLDGTLTWGTDEIDDLWHTAINGRGRYLSAKSPQQLVSSFNVILKNVLDRTSTAAPVSLNSGSISSETKLFQVKFSTNDWTGELVSLPISDGSMNSTCTATDDIGDICAPEWEAGCLLDGGYCEMTNSTEAGVDWNTGRVILTYNPISKEGVPFRWANISSDPLSLTDQQDQLNLSDGRGSDRLNYLRGDKSKEISNFDATSCSDCDFRNRTSLLGDVINSAPLYVGSPYRFYSDSMEASSYSTFRNTYSSRQGVVYAGANDGMLHAFNATTGREMLAYVPNEVFANLAALTSNNYTHKTFVDGQLAEGDVYFNNSWHSVVVGGLGLGGQGMYALDVSNPGSFSEANAKSLVLWEFTDANDADLGYTYGTPQIRKLNNGKWAAIFGNGYDSTLLDGATSTSGEAAIFIVDISNGSLIKKISTGIGAAKDPTGANRANAITGVATVDVNNDFKVDFVYAGDLFGNIWRFNLEGNTNTWAPAFGGKPLYTAKDISGAVQPITTKVAVSFHQTMMGTMVYFGTGKYLSVNDVTDTSRQTFYGIWDRWFDTDADSEHDEKDFVAFSRSSLQVQEILGVDADDFTENDARVTTKNPIDWDTQLGWYLELVETGERVFQPPFLRNDRIIFTTATPTDDPCTSGGTSWLMELDAYSGARLDVSPFDYNQDGVTDTRDNVNFDVDGDGSDDWVAGSGIRANLTSNPTGGIVMDPAVLKLPGRDNERKYMATSTGDIIVVDESTGRRLKQSWRQIKECGI